MEINFREVWRDLEVDDAELALDTGCQSDQGRKTAYRRAYAWTVPLTSFEMFSWSHCVFETLFDSYGLSNVWT